MNMEEPKPTIYSLNREVLNERSKKYYHDNKERIRASKNFQQYNREYYQANKKRITQQRKEKPVKKTPVESVVCICGSVCSNKYSLPRHMTSSIHVKNMKRLETDGQNTERQVEYNNTNKHRLIKCECGAEIISTNNGLNNHMKTKKHADLMRKKQNTFQEDVIAKRMLYYSI